jgi:glycosyltransferase involved in cell wall biosynthesis
MSVNRSAGKRVLMLLENSIYPADPRVFAEATALTEAGYQVTVIAPAVSGQPLYEVLNAVRVCRFPLRPSGNGLLGYLWEYGYSMAATFVISLVVFARYGFDVVHANNPPDTFVLIAAFYKLFGVRFIFDHHDLSPEMYYARFGGRGSRFIYHVLVFLERLSCRLADHVIATNESYKTIEMQRGGVPERRITIVRNGPNLDRVRLVDPDPGLRQRARTIIGYMGAMGVQDGVDYLLRALWHLIHDLRRTDFFCVLIGPEDPAVGLKALIIELGLEEHVWRTGYIPHADLLSYLSTADICVDPDPSNPFNDRCTMTKMMVYMALGKPTVAFDLPEHRFTAQRAALYVRPNDELEFARGLVELMDDAERRQAMGSFGRQRVESALAWSYSVPALLEVYGRVTAAPASTDASLTTTLQTHGGERPEIATGRLRAR